MTKLQSKKSVFHKMQANRTIDPVCGRKMNKNKAHIIVHHMGEKFYLCCPKCQSEFEKSPEKYITNIQ